MLKGVWSSICKNWSLSQPQVVQMPNIITKAKVGNYQSNQQLTGAACDVQHHGVRSPQHAVYPVDANNPTGTQATLMCRLCLAWRPFPVRSAVFLCCLVRPARSRDSVNLLHGLKLNSLCCARFRTTCLGT